VKMTTKQISQLKGVRPIVAVTAYDAVMAKYASNAGVDLILVGDSVGTTQLGYETTVPVTLEMMLHHTAAVVRAEPDALVVADVPFGRAHSEFKEVFDNCCRLIQEGGAQAVKIEGGKAMAPTVKRLINAGIPVLGHMGLLPQEIHKLGAYRKFGRTEAEKDVLLEDALALEAAGCFAVICEMLDGTVAGAITSQLSVPLIGIGSGPHCDGQILVCNDLLGMNTGYVPSFVKKYAEVGSVIETAFKAYAKDVRKGKFPE